MKTAPAVQRVPLTTEEHRQRYPKAVEEVHDIESIRLGLAIEPGRLPQNVFDFPDGMRLIVSRERDMLGRISIHFSASFAPESQLWRDIKFRRVSKNAALDLIIARWREISWSRDEPKLAGFSEEKGVPHWYVDEQ